MIASNRYPYSFLAAVILCPELSAPADGGVTLNTQTFGVGTTATYSCDPGYILVGEISTIRTCEDTHRGTTGTWNGTEPLCDGMQTLMYIGVEIGGPGGRPNHSLVFSNTKNSVPHSTKHFAPTTEYTFLHL